MSKTELEKSFEDLFDEDKITQTRRSAEHKYRDLTSGEILRLQKKAKTDLYFLCGLLGYDLLSPTFHGHLTKFIQRTEGSQYRLFLAPRGHYKSTVKTEADSIRMILPDFAEIGTYPYSLGTNIKLLIAHEVRETATKFLINITSAFTRNELMMALFPKCIPSRNVQRMNKFELEIPRTIHHKEPTVSTIGSGGAAQGGHYHWIALDDIIGEDARESKTVMRRTIEWFDNANSLLTRRKLDGWDLTGTRWAYSDVYSHAMERYGIDVENSVLNCISQRDIDKFSGGILKVYARGAIENGVPVFPEEFPIEQLNIERRNKFIWASQYANNPVESGLNEFTWPLKYYNVDVNDNIVVFSGESSKKFHPFSLDICIFCDPSMGESDSADETGIVVTGVDSKSNIYLLETVKKRLRPPELVDKLYELNNRWRPRLIAIEEVNFSGIYKYWIEERSRERRVYLPIRSYNPGSKRSKEGRIRSLAHFFSAGQVYVSEGMFDFRDEYDQFPLGKSQHLLDALAQGPEYWTKGIGTSDIEAYRKKEREILDERSTLTGY